MKFLLGTKISMTQKFLADGTVVPVTAIQAGPCVVTQVKGDKDGYQAVQVGFGKKKSLSKPVAGHLKGLGNFRWLKEFRSAEKVERGQQIDLSTFVVGDLLKITGWSKGKGFQGVVKRHGFHGSPKTHGHKDQLRMPGSIGAGEPQRVFKGKRMAGHMGDAQISTKDLEVIEIDAPNNIVYVKGAVPGARNGLVMLQAEGDLSVVTPEVPKSAVTPEVAVEKDTDIEKEIEAVEETTTKSMMEPAESPEAGSASEETPVMNQTDIDLKEDKPVVE